MHLVTFHKVIEDFKPQVFIVDPISNLSAAGKASEVKSILTRLIDYLKMKKISTFLTRGPGTSESSKASLNGP